MRGRLGGSIPCPLAATLMSWVPAHAAPCPNCFAVFAMSDTQAYTFASGFGALPANHLDLVTRYICANRTAWKEPSTGKEMPILMVLQLGDLIEGGAPAIRGPQWAIISSAFDNLDHCDPVVPYVVAIGNHETEPRNFYQAATTSFQTHFGADRWADYQCADPTNCDWDAGEWFIGGGDPVAAGSRDNIDDWIMTLSNVGGSFDAGDPVEWGVDGVGVVQRWKPSTDRLNAYQISGAPVQAGDTVTIPGGGASGDVTEAVCCEQSGGASPGPGPPTDEPGRHRAAAVRAPNGQRWVFLGVEVAFDFPPALHPSEGDDAAWLIQVMSDYAGAPTVMAHHSLFSYTGGWTNNTAYNSDSMFTTEAIWDHLVEPYPQLVSTFNANVAGTGLVRQDEWVWTTAAGYDVFSFLRNYAGGWYPSGWADGSEPLEENGWHAIAVFDPDAGEIRIRSYRIDDTDDDFTFDGVPEATENLDMDFFGYPEVVFAHDFPDTRPASLDNCPAVSNPGQWDLDGDGLGDACDPDIDGDALLNAADNCPSAANPGQADGDLDGAGDACDNCPGLSNPGQPDANGDGFGDACQPDDSDGDAWPDAEDNCPTIANGPAEAGNPNIGNQSDPDGDGAGNACDADDDGDGLLDGVETDTGVFVDASDTGTDPLNPDSDGDGLLDGVETHTGVYVDASDTGTDPLNPDSDADGLLDGVETRTGAFVDAGNTGTDPLNPDSDGDGLSDGVEVTQGSDPNNPFSIPSLGPFGLWLLIGTLMAMGGLRLRS